MVEIGNAGQWDRFAAWRLRRALARLRPDAVIAHGNRAIALMRRAARGMCPVVAVTHNINIKSAIGAARASTYEPKRIGGVAMADSVTTTYRFVPRR